MKENQWIVYSVSLVSVLVIEVSRGKIMHIMHLRMISKFQITDILNIAFATANEKPPSR